MHQAQSITKGLLSEEEDAPRSWKELRKQTNKQTNSAHDQFDPVFRHHVCTFLSTFKVTNLLSKGYAVTTDLKMS